MNKAGENYILRFIRSSGVFFVAIVIPKIVVFLLLSFNTAHIRTADYGYYDLSISYMTLAAYLLFFDIWISMMRFMYEKENDSGKDTVIRSGNRVFLISCGLYAAAAILVGLLFSVRYLFWIFLYGLTQNAANMYVFAARGYGKNNDFAVSGLVGSAFLAALNILLIRSGWDFSALYAAGIAGFVVQIAYLEIRVGYLRRIARADLAPGLTKTLLTYTLPLGINSAAFWTLTSFNKIILARVLDLSSNGIYAVAEKLAGVLTFAVLCFTYAWQDIAFDNDEIDKGKFYSDACSLYFGFLSFAVLLMMPLIKAVFPLLIDEAYSPAALVIPFAVIATALSGYSLFMSNIFHAVKEPKAVSASTFAACLINFAICYPCIRYFGIMGASIAIMISFTADAVIKGTILKQKIGFRHSLKTALPFTAAVASGVLIYNYMSTAVNLIWFAVCLAGFAGALFIRLKRKQ